jgi:hypothetical protein
LRKSYPGLTASDTAIHQTVRNQTRTWTTELDIDSDSGSGSGIPSSYCLDNSKRNCGSYLSVVSGYSQRPSRSTTYDLAQSSRSTKTRKACKKQPPNLVFGARSITIRQLSPLSAIPLGPARYVGLHIERVSGGLRCRRRVRTRFLHVAHITASRLR